MNKSDSSIKKWTWSSRLTKEQSEGLLNGIYNALVSHIGKPILFFRKERREMIPILVTPIKACQSYVSAIHYSYDIYGNVASTIPYTISLNNVLTGEQRVVYFDDGI